MPFVSISLKTGKTQAFKTGVSQAVHHALMDAFNVPEDDLFQVISEYDAQNIIYPEQYLGIRHSSDIIYIRITAKRGRSVDMKKSLYRKIADNIEADTGHKQNDVFITITENAEENWSFGNGEAQLVED